MLAHGAVFIQIVAVRDHYLSAAFSSLWLEIKVFQLLTCRKLV
ncbi:hypothetical protein PsAD37_04766 [Pseudovibrio sp. Ad37]|nr:hypothetical protein PsAD37_04766 [Pseudovibrio sp. Ad37]